ncbi:MAG: hypothetical protein OEV99_11135 [Nitrospira sp.]|nr:hypothetical protein [Nitrospira sp.]MDH4370387.1 hypothetical protein [Nitrospira sp.]MDH5498207.1 hypothetical protein [Nitrospira sp.]
MLLTDEETALVADAQFFRKKAVITAKIRAQLEATHKALAQELTSLSLVTPPGFDATVHQLVKGEHLEEFPYQYLDCPKHFAGSNTFTFRTLVWWGHHITCALLLEGAGIPQYKRQFLGRFHQLAGHELELSLAPSLWEWKRGEGYTLPITHNRKAQIAAVLADRSFMKVVRCVPFVDLQIEAGQLAQVVRGTLRSMLPIVTP